MTISSAGPSGAGTRQGQAPLRGITRRGAAASKTVSNAGAGRAPHVAMPAAIQAFTCIAPHCGSSAGDAPDQHLVGVQARARSGGAIAAAISVAMAATIAAAVAIATGPLDSCAMRGAASATFVAGVASASRGGSSAGGCHHRGGATCVIGKRRKVSFGQGGTLDQLM